MTNMGSARRAVAVGILLLPLVAAAQEARVCTPPETPLARGDESAAVANLQIFLARSPGIYPEKITSGFYGPATERAVGRWQVKFGVVRPATDRSGGLGAAGPRTVALLKKLWECDGPVSAGWFSASVSGGSTSFSAQASSTFPLNPSLFYIDFGDGARGTVAVSNAVCRDMAGGCSSLLAARHSYAAGSFTASLKIIHPTEHCSIFSPAWICAQAATTRILGTTTVASGGLPSAAQSVSRDEAAASDATPYVLAVRVPGARPASVSGAVVLSGGTLTISWKSAGAPIGASADIMLADAKGNVLGTIARDANASGSYWWAIPRRSNDVCASNALACLAEVAGTSSCQGGICPLDDGTYDVSARIRYAGNTLGSGKIGTFALGGGNVSVPLVAAPETGSAAATSSYGSYGAAPADNAVPPKSCTYSGVQYGDGIALDVSCADVAGMTCKGYGGQALTCRNGSWVNASGTAVSIPNVTSAPQFGGLSCKTPWGGQIVVSGNQITYEPFFTGGNYTGATVIPLMQCTNGKWQKCDWNGANCRAYSTL